MDEPFTYITFAFVAAAAAAIYVYFVVGAIANKIYLKNRVCVRIEDAQKHVKRRAHTCLCTQYIFNSKSETVNEKL